MAYYSDSSVRLRQTSYAASSLRPTAHAPLYHAIVQQNYAGQVKLLIFPRENISAKYIYS